MEEMHRARCGRRGPELACFPWACTTLPAPYHLGSSRDLFFWDLTEALFPRHDGLNQLPLVS